MAAFDVKALESKLAPVVVPVVFQWVKDSVAAELASGGSAALGVVPVVLDAIMPAVLAELAKLTA